jgi:hypothetical protein
MAKRDTGKASFPTLAARPSYSRDTFQWIVERQNDGQWSIRSVKCLKYLGFEDTPKDGAPAVGLDKPHLWDIEIQPDGEDDDNTKLSMLCRAHYSA